MLPGQKPLFAVAVYSIVHACNDQFSGHTLTSIQLYNLKELVRQSTNVFWPCRIMG